jgi:hypothetical protein
MQFDYFYGQQADQYYFYSIPKLLITSDLFWNISADTKLLYGILLDRMNLSAKNGWLDEKGRVYIIYTLEETMAALNCGNQKATKLFNELEKKCGLIERKRQGLGKPNLIYVKNFITGIYVFGTDIHGQALQGEFVRTSAIADSHSFITTHKRVDTHKHGIQLMHSIDAIKSSIGMAQNKVKTILERLFRKGGNPTRKLIALETAEFYAFVINNQHKLKEEFLQLLLRWQFK